MQWCRNVAIKIMPNPDPLGRNPYSKAVFKAVTGSFWGKGVPKLMDYAQDLANSSARSIVNNCGIASGPQVDVDISQIPQEQLATAQKLWPWKVWLTESKPGTTRPAVNFWQAQLLVDQLMAVLDKAMQLGEDATGIPKYAYGNDELQGAASTASGLNMLINSAARGIKKSVANSDRAFSRLLEGIVAWVMLYDEDQSIKGDVQVVTEGTISVMLTELRQARIGEFLDRLTNPVILEAAGPEALIETLRQYGELLKIDVENKLPSKIEVQNRIAAARKAQQEAAAAEIQEKQAKTMAEIETKKAELELKRMEIELKAEEQKIRRAQAVQDMQAKSAMAIGAPAAVPAPAEENPSAPY